MIEIRSREDGETMNLAIQITNPGKTEEMVKELREKLREVEINCSLCMITGNLTIPLSMVVAHHAVHRAKAVAVFDPSINRYIVVVSHSHGWKVGDSIPI